MSIRKGNAGNFEGMSRDEFKGLRFVPSDSGMVCRVLLRDGGSVPLSGVGQKRLFDMKVALDAYGKGPGVKQLKM